MSTTAPPTDNVHPIVKDSQDALSAQKEYVFEHEGKEYVYRFDDLPFVCAKSAEAVYAFYADLAKRPPRNLTEHFQLGCHEIEAQALSYLLRERDGDGELKPFDIDKTPKVNLKIIRQFDIKQVGRVEVALDHFFDKINRSTLVYIVRQRHELDATMMFAEAELRMTQYATQKEPSAPSLREIAGSKLSEASELSSSDSETQERTTSTSSSQGETPSE